MPRYRILVEYDGTPFVGWQVQANGQTVAGAIASALQKLTGRTVPVHGAGRTDAGVHALAQVAHFDLDTEWDPLKLR
jgi:tRNA pseudouridine38-40 synthase